MFGKTRTTDDRQLRDLQFLLLRVGRMTYRRPYAPFATDDRPLHSSSPFSHHTSTNGKKGPKPIKATYSSSFGKPLGAEVTAFLRSSAFRYHSPTSLASLRQTPKLSPPKQKSPPKSTHL